MLNLTSPAKINLFLRVVSRRDDGYHELASLFQMIDLCDTLHFSFAKEDSLICTDPTIPTDKTNLVSKAIALFREKTGFLTPIAVRIEKKIPQQAGLGGGSSNAATTLLALNQLFRMPASTELLSLWSAELGSDVPFFLSNGTAYCTGRGEKILNVKALVPRLVTIIKPSYGMPTPLVYKNLDLKMLLPRDPKIILDRFLEGNLEYFNDLEIPAFQVRPELFKLKKQLIDSGFSTVQMCGSGSSFFCLGDGDISKIKDVLVWKAHFLNR